jgi:hypothetical protein
MPLITTGSAGVTASETSRAAVTVRIVEAEIPPDAAVMEVCPSACDEASPFEPFSLLTVATEAVPESQVTSEVMTRVEPSVYVPVAWNCCDVPSAMPGFSGEIAIETRAAPVTVRVVLPEMSPDVAVIVVDPTAAEAASPFEPSESLTAATAVSEELHFTASVISSVVWSEKTPVALNCWDVPNGMLGLAGETSIETSAGPSSPPPHPQPDTKEMKIKAAISRIKLFFIPFSFPPFFSCEDRLSLKNHGKTGLMSRFRLKEIENYVNPVSCPAGACGVSEKV